MLVKLQRPPPEIKIFFPGRSACSNRATRRPRLPASAAHINPAAPAPKMTTSYERLRQFLRELAKPVWHLATPQRKGRTDACDMPSGQYRWRRRFFLDPERFWRVKKEVKRSLRTFGLTSLLSSFRTKFRCYGPGSVCSGEMEIYSPNLIAPSRSLAAETGACSILQPRSQRAAPPA